MPVGKTYKEMTRFVNAEIKKTNPAEQPNTSVIVAQKGKSYFIGRNNCSQYLYLESGDESIWVFRQHKTTDTDALNAAQKKASEFKSKNETLLEEKQAAEKRLAESVQDKNKLDQAIKAKEEEIKVLKEQAKIATDQNAKQKQEAEDRAKKDAQRILDLEK